MNGVTGRVARRGLSEPSGPSGPLGVAVDASMDELAGELVLAAMAGARELGLEVRGGSPR